METELLIAGARVVDEHGIRTADVAVDGGRITAVGPNLPVSSAGERIDGSGRLLCPGFIDLHAHSALRSFDDPLLSAKVGQGFTTELICPDGLGPAPVTDALLPGRKKYLHALEPSTAAPWDWRTMGEFLGALDSSRPATNMVSCVPHSAVRETVIGATSRQPDRREMSAMKDLVGQSLEAGCRAVSFGMIYAPGLYAATDELIGIAEVAARYNVPLVPHVRNEARGVLDSIGEFVRVAELTGAALHVSHVKLVGCADLLGDLIDLLSAAQDRIRLTFDQYPYGAGSTLLAALLPPYAFDGGPAAMLDRLQNPRERERMARDMYRGLDGWENLFEACGPDNVVITQAAAPRDGDIGKTLARIAEETGTDPAFVVMDLLLDTDLDAGMIDHYSAESVVKEIFLRSGALVGSDGVFNPHPHPRLYGTAPKVLGRFALQEKLISVPEAVARLSSRPARLLGLDDRGRIAEGLRADMILLDPERYIDNATFDAPHQYPAGVDLVTVGGTAVWRNGQHTGARPGTVASTAAAESL
ncbi:N-acyl-D-amino-acid deacylase family protein [Arthrobacter sp. TB 26]|uniref:N-acyl-D-amino-acid deacylase family protein n=1 Tax=Arthrobacter sp. TB 26 TaxID=494420 RepID=UPI0003F680DA|nr:amidohydrolase family protein [Arthrobacter sp. TB 26]